MGEDSDDSGDSGASDNEQESTKNTEEFYTMATDHLVEARRDIASFSFQRAADRIAGRKRKLDEEAEGGEER